MLPPRYINRTHFTSLYFPRVSNSQKFTWSWGKHLQPTFYIAKHDFPNVWCSNQISDHVFAFLRLMELKCLWITNVTLRFSCVLKTIPLAFEYMKVCRCGRQLQKVSGFPTAEGEFPIVTEGREKVFTAKSFYKIFRHWTSADNNYKCSEIDQKCLRFNS